MRRYISLACVALIVVMCMASPVSAADVGQLYYECLDYTTVSPESNRVDFSTSMPTVYIQTPFYNDWFSCDIFLYSTDAFSVSVLGQSLSVDHISGGYYRVYGKLPGNFFTELPLLFNFSGASGTLFFYSVRVFSRDTQSFNIPLEGIGTYSSGSFDMSKNFGDTRPTRTIITNDSFDNRDFILYLSSPDWRKYDFIEFQTYFTVASIDSISCVFGSGSIPVEVSYIYPDSSDQSFYVTLRIDCRNLDKTLSDDFYPMVIVMGQEIYDGVSLVALMDSNGYLLTDSISSDSIFFQKLFDKLYNHFDSLNGWIQAQTNSINYMQQRLLDEIYTHFNNLRIWIENQTNSIVSAIRGEPSDGDDLQDGAEQIQDSVEDISKFEQDQQAVLDNNFNVIQDAVSVTGFAAALAFVQRYTEGIFLGMGDFFIVFSLPLFLGLFFYICSRVPRGTHWLSRPKDGDS